MPDPRKVRADANAMVAMLLERLAQSEVNELEVKRGGVRVRVAKDGGRIAASSSEAPAAAHAAPAAAAVPAKQLPTVNAPLTGIFYRATSPQTEPFVQVGSSISTGDVIGLIEAMKLFNEIRATASGKVRRIFAENGQLVRAHQPLLEVDPT
ncbi:MAG: acetyl-CoA carboxylase biotin carboxyl carrier protein [Chloroflexi bacterium]|nr:MAG: acetyl-CoA carboxylase biotin carboxyl carrier protein [Chloroflexota bacterium]